MKNKKILLAILTTALIITLTFASCGGGGGGGSGPSPSPAPVTPATPTNPTSKIFESSDKDGNIYILEVTASASKASVSRATTYTPKDGDTFTFTIITSSGKTWTDSGTVKTSGITLTLKLSESKTLTITVSDNSMVKIEVPEGTTITIDSTPITTVDNLTATPPVNPKFELKASKYDVGQSWEDSIPLKTVTKAIPKKDDKFRFRVRGTTDKTLVNFRASLATHTEDWSHYQWLGGAEYVKGGVSGTFDETFEITIGEDPKDGYIINFTLANNDVPLPANYENNKTVVATISNFEVRLVGITRN